MGFLVRKARKSFLSFFKRFLKLEVHF